MLPKTKWIFFVINWIFIKADSNLFRPSEDPHSAHLNIPDRASACNGNEGIFSDCVCARLIDWMRKIYLRSREEEGEDVPSRAVRNHRLRDSGVEEGGAGIVLERVFTISEAVWRLVCTHAQLFHPQFTMWPVRAAGTFFFPLPYRTTSDLQVALKTSCCEWAAMEWMR